VEGDRGGANYLAIFTVIEESSERDDYHSSFVFFFLKKYRWFPPLPPTSVGRGISGLQERRGENTYIGDSPTVDEVSLVKSRSVNTRIQRVSSHTVAGINSIILFG